MALIKCEECGKSISDKAKSCPHCGNPIKNNKTIGGEENNSLCLGGMVVGIISFFIDFFGLVSAVGLVMSIIALSKSPSGKNRTYAIVGIICSGIELVVKFIQLVKLMSLGY